MTSTSSNSAMGERGVSDLTRRTLVVSVGLCTLCASVQAVKAKVLGQNRPIRIIVPRSPGGSVDVIGRKWSEAVGRLGTKTFIENIGGGGGRIGRDTVARASADGHTLLIGTTSEIVLSPIIDRGAFDPTKDLADVGILSTSPIAICANVSLPIHNLHELVAYGKANPTKLNFGSAGTGTIGHLEGELLKQVTGLPSLTHIPYRGGSPAILDVIGGRLTFAIVSISTSIVDMHRAGKLRIIAITSAKDVAAAPGIPTVIEQGYPKLVAEFFIGLFAPAAVPDPVLDGLADETRSAMQDPNVREALSRSGFSVSDTNRAAAKAYIKGEIERWKGVLSASSLIAK